MGRKSEQRKRRVSAAPKRPKLDSGKHAIADVQRARLFAQVDLHTESNFYSGFSGDLSDGGLFVATYEPLSLGQPVHVELSLPGGLFLSAKGRVAWLREPVRMNRELVPGAGIAFEELDESVQRAAAQFMAHREPTFVDCD